MALLAEQLVDEWLNRNGFFTLRGVKRGVNEIDLLGIRAKNGSLEGWHIEVQVSFRPIGYIGKLSKDAQKETAAKSASSAKKRSGEILKSSIDDWVQKKFFSSTKREMRDSCWNAINWKFKLVHAHVHDKAELSLIQSHGIELIRLETVLEELCGHKPGELFGGAGTDIAEIIRYYAEHRKTIT